MTDEPEDRSPSQRIVDLFSDRLCTGAADFLINNSTDERWESAQKTKESLLREQAKRIVAQVQGTMALEGQGLDQEQIEEMIERTYQELKD